MGDSPATYHSLWTEVFQPVARVPGMQRRFVTAREILRLEFGHVVLEAPREFPHRAVLRTLIRGSVEGIACVIHHVVGIGLSARGRVRCL